MPAMKIINKQVLGMFNASEIPLTSRSWLSSSKASNLGSLSFRLPRPNHKATARHIGDDEGQIAPVVLQRARALYLEKVSEGAIKNPCYFAMDATRPGGLGRRFYVICETDQAFRAISAGHGNGRNLRGIADFSNGIRCAKNFSTAMDSKLTTGGAYVTSEEITSFKGYYRGSTGKNAALTRSFVQLDGEGDTANARPRAIGGHPAVLLRGVRLRKDPDSPYANKEGYVPFGTLVNYTAGRSNGCTSWSPSDASQIVPMVKDKPTTLYIYPESTDIDAVAQAVKAGRSPSRAGLSAFWATSSLPFASITSTSPDGASATTFSLVPARAWAGSRRRAQAMTRVSSRDHMETPSCLLILFKFVFACLFVVGST
jgi:hypothetical protein